VKQLRDLKDIENDLNDFFSFGFAARSAINRVSELNEQFISGFDRPAGCGRPSEVNFAQLVRRPKMFRRIGLSALVMASLAVLGISPAANAGEKDIVDTAVAADGFQTLVTAVKAAGLVDALKSEGPFTVFAPTDEAFGKLPKGTVESLLKDKEKLQAVLKYHVVPGKVTAAQVVKLRSADTLLGQPLDIAAGDGVKINQANVVKTDIMCTNGVIHVIDAVLLPK
jgi:uncharacterized surface protein with fasciclin (FAS1) repeats